MNPAKEEAVLRIKSMNDWLKYLDDNNLAKPEKYIEDQVISFDAEYGRIGLIWIGRNECVGCHVKKQCLVVDQSEGEYTQATICFECLDILRRATE